MTRLLTRLRTRRVADGGFSIIEIVVAAGVLFVVLVVMAHSAVVALVDVGHSRQRQSATGLANQALEQLRALPAAVVRQGLSTIDLASSTDPRITTTVVDGVTTYFYDGEAIVAHTPATTDLRPPLTPHIQSVAVGTTTYEVASYITSTGSADTLRATVAVSWADQALRQGASGEVVSQTLFSADVGCGGQTAQNPYAAPCAADFEAVATITRGGIVIEANQSLGAPFEFATLDLAEQSSSITAGHVAVVTSEATTPGVSLKDAGSPVLTAGALGVTAHTSSDPTANTGDYDDQRVTGGPRVPQSTTGTKNDIRVTSSAADMAEAVSTAAALNQDAGSCHQADGRPCGRAAAQQMDDLSASLTLADNTGSPIASRIIGLGKELVPPSSTWVDRTVDPSEPLCGAEGCIDASAERRMGAMRLGTLPLPSLHGDGSFTELVRVEDVQVSTYAAAGAGATAPSVGITAGTVSYWDSSIGAYTAIPLSTSEQSFTTTYEVRGLYHISMQGEFTVGGATLNDPDASAAARTEASASVRVLHGNFTYTVRSLDGSETFVDLKIGVDLGEVRSTASYKRPLNVF